MAKAWEILKALEEGQPVSYRMSKDGGLREIWLEKSIGGTFINGRDLGCRRIGFIVDHPERFEIGE